MLLVPNYVLRLWGGIARDRGDLVLVGMTTRSGPTVMMEFGPTPWS